MSWLYRLLLPISEASSAFTERSCRCFPLHPDLDWGTLRWTTFVVVNVGGMKLALEVEKVKEIVDVEDSRVLPDADTDERTAVLF